MDALVTAMKTKRSNGRCDEGEKLKDVEAASILRRDRSMGAESIDINSDDSSM